MSSARRKAAVGLLGLAVAWGEVVHWWASRERTHGRGVAEAVVVLGYRERGRERANTVNRWRVRAAVRSAGPQTRLVCCGGSRDGGVPEARLMARYAVQECGFTGPVMLEERSLSTWENVANAIPLVEDAERIVVVSDPLHGLKARLYLAKQRPDLAARLIRAADYRQGEWCLLKPLLAVHGLRRLRSARRR
jgi:uncharacterized SAM-binding protein YcdF (DUF218 family)